MGAENDPNPTPTPTPTPTPAPNPTPSSAPNPTPTPSAAEELLAAEKARNAALQAERDAERAKAARLQEQVEASERAKLEQDGNYKALAEKAQEDAARARAEADAALSRAADVQVNSELRLALIRSGVVDPDVASLVDRSALRVEGGRVVGIDEAVNAFKTAKPHLFGTAPTLPASTATGGTQPTPSGGNPPPKNVMSMSRQEYEEHKKKTIRDLRVAGRRR